MRNMKYLSKRLRYQNIVILIKNKLILHLIIHLSIIYYEKVMIRNINNHNL